MTGSNTTDLETAPWCHVEVTDRRGRVVVLDPEHFSGREFGPEEEVAIRRAIELLHGYVGPVKS